MSLCQMCVSVLECVAACCSVCTDIWGEDVCLYVRCLSVCYGVAVCCSVCTHIWGDDACLYVRCV